MPCDCIWVNTLAQVLCALRSAIWLRFSGAGPVAVGCCARNSARPILRSPADRPSKLLGLGGADGVAKVPCDPALPSDWAHAGPASASNAAAMSSRVLALI